MALPRGGPAVGILRWIARVLGVLLLALVVWLLVTDWPDYRGAPPLRDSAQFLALFATLCGFALLWWREGPAGLLVIGGMLCFYAINYWAWREFPDEHFLLFYTPGLLAVVCWWLATARGQVSPLRTLLKRPLPLTIVIAELAGAIVIVWEAARPQMTFLRGVVAAIYRPAVLGGPVPVGGEAVGRTVERGCLGVYLSSGAAQQAGTLEAGQGAVVAAVIPGSVAERAGVLPGDVIVKADGSPVASRSDLQAMIAQRRPYQTVRLHVLRKEAEATREVIADVCLISFSEMQGLCAKACWTYAKAVGINPRDAKAYYDWGVGLAHLGKRAEAEEKWNKAAELNPALGPQIEEIRKQLLGKE